VDGFRQNESRDGAPVSQRTGAYLVCDHLNLSWQLSRPLTLRTIVQ
jgi:hypothetical protein